MRSFVVIGQTATASPDFRLDDLPSSSGRLDVLLRCIRAAFLFSHGLRSDVRIYLVLRGGASAPRVLRLDSNTARFVRPDERSLALLVQKTLAGAPPGLTSTFVDVRPGIGLARGDLDCVLGELGSAALYLLQEQAPDLRSTGAGALAIPEHAAFFVGDHLGFAEPDVARLSAAGAAAISIGPVSLHSDDVIAVLSNELARTAASAG